MVRFIFDNLLHLFYPKVCVTCGTSLVKNEQVLCTRCLYDIPQTNFHKERENPVARLFWGRTHVEFATAYYYFNKGSIYRKLLHELKYKGYTEIGNYMGKHIGYALKTSPFADVDLIFPVPLHYSKQKMRGYNQSECIAAGIAAAMDKPMDTNNIYRAINTDTQTKRSRYERWENVNNIFKLRDPDAIKGRHVLLVDDVVTTGSTLEACINPLLNVEGVRVSVVTMAVA